MRTNLVNRLVFAVTLAAAAGGAQAAGLSYTGATDPYTDGARTLAGMDRSGVSASPARTADPYLDGSYA